MTVSDRDDLIRYIKDLTAKIGTSKEADKEALDILVRSGIYNDKGELQSPYK